MGNFKSAFGGKNRGFISFIFVFLLFSCTNSDKNSKSLDLANQLLFSKPDSTLRIITQLKKSENQSDVTKARIRILELNAWYRTYQLDTIPSELYSILRFFRQKDLKKEEGQTYYLLGSLKYIHNSQDSAIFYLKKAEILLRDSKEDYYYGMLCFYLGDLYLNKEFFDNSLQCYLKSMQKLENLKDTLHLSFVYSRIAEIYRENQRPNDSVYFYANRSIAMASKSNNTNILFYNILKKAEYLNSDSILSSKRLLLELYHQGYKHKRLYLLLAQNYINESKIDSAKYFQSF